MCLHVTCKICYNGDNDNDDNCANGADEIIFVIIGKGYVEAICAIALRKKINKYGTTNTLDLKNGISMLFTLIRQ